MCNSVFLRFIKGENKFKVTYKQIDNCYICVKVYKEQRRHQLGYPQVEKLQTRHIELLRELDAEIFPAEMLLSHEDYQKLTSTQGGILVTFIHEGKTLGAAFGIVATAMQEELQQQDPDFVAHPFELYSYSVGVLPKYQRQGIGTELLCALARAGKAKGYTSLSSHVRAKEAWVHKRKKILGITTTRSVPLFWGDPNEPVEYQFSELAANY
jgi:ribosomal protein S18 acetylase RimI-like enzyme